MLTETLIYAFATGLPWPAATPRPRFAGAPSPTAWGDKVGDKYPWLWEGQAG